MEGCNWSFQWEAPFVKKKEQREEIKYLGKKGTRVVFIFSI